MITATRKIRFCAGHIVTGHESKCANFHGHDYQVEFMAEAESMKLDDVGRVIDFSVLKERIGGWIDENFDHKFLIWENDEHTEANFPGIVRVPFNPTAENIAAFFGDIICPRLLDGTGVRVVHVRCHETPNCFADWYRIP